MPVAGLKALVDAIAKDEGSRIVNGRHRLYKCPAKKLTIGYGRNIEDNGISDVEARDLLMADVLEARRDAASLVPNWLALDVVRQNVVSNMVFNMGKKKLSGFPNFLAAVNEQRFEDAANEMKYADGKTKAALSLWYTQTGHRALRLTDEMLTGTVA